MFRFKPQYHKRFDYEPNASEVWKLPSGNIFSAINGLAKLEVNIASGGATNAPDFQVLNAIETLELIRDSKTSVWRLSGQAIGLLATRGFPNGAAGANNLAVAGSAASNVLGQHYFSLKASPMDALVPWDFGIDTRAHDYELRIKWRDLTAVGTLFGTHTGAITATNSENYLYIELENIVPGFSPVTGKADALSKVAPLLVGYREEKKSVDASNTQYRIDVPEFQKFHNILLYTTHVANTAQEVGEADIIQNKVRLFNTQQETFQDVRVDMLKEKTSIRWGLGTNINAGFYDLNQTAFGSVLDTLVSNNVNDLFLELDVVKQSNSTYVRPIYITQEQQGAI
jgi:hypothetical protein